MKKLSYFGQKSLATASCGMGFDKPPLVGVFRKIFPTGRFSSGAIGPVRHL